MTADKCSTTANRR